MIQVTNLTKTFDEFKALDHMNCQIKEGCVYGMVGSNGAGKSTFLRLLAGIYRPDEGEILIDGEPVFENPTVKSKIAFVPDDLFFLPGASLTRMAQLYEHVYPTFDRERFKYLVETFQLDPGKSIQNFSKGMKRQSAIILALSCHARYLFFDETFDGLDPVMRNLVKSLIAHDVLEEKATVIITSHSLRELEDICDQLALLHQGGIVLENDITDLKTALFKIQIAFDDEYNEKRFADIEYLHYSKQGSVATLIVRGDQKAVVSYMRSMDPLLLDILTLTLEEVFTYELEALGYHFDISDYDSMSEASAEGTGRASYDNGEKVQKKRGGER